MTSAQIGKTATVVQTFVAMGLLVGYSSINVEIVGTACHLESALGQGCAKTSEGRVFVGSPTIPEASVVEPGVICEVDFHETGAPPTFSHSLGLKQSLPPPESGQSQPERFASECRWHVGCCSKQPVEDEANPRSAVQFLSLPTLPPNSQSFGANTALQSIS